MSHTQRHPTTTTEFLKLEEQQEGNCEIDGHGIVAMTSAIVAHSTIRANVPVAFQTGLRDKAYRARGVPADSETLVLREIEIPMAGVCEDLVFGLT